MLRFRQPCIPLGRNGGKRGPVCCLQSPSDALGVGLGSSTLGSSGMLHEAAFAELQSFPGSQSPEKKFPAQD